MTVSMPQTNATATVSALAAFSGVVFAAATLLQTRSSAMKRSRSGSVSWDLPEWAAEYATPAAMSKIFKSDAEMMAVAVELSRRNVAEGTGGPFGSAVFERHGDGTATLVSVGCNRVVPMNNSGLHGETVAIQIAQAQLGLYSLRAEGGNFEVRAANWEIRLHGPVPLTCQLAPLPSQLPPRFPLFPFTQLFTSCEPCCMCLGATLWSGVNRLVCAAKKDDASAIGFDEGPVFDESYEHLERSGVEVVRNVLQKEVRCSEL